MTEEQQSSLPIFNATLLAAVGWSFFRVARSTVMRQIAALRSRLEKQPPDLLRSPRDLGDGALGPRNQQLIYLWIVDYSWEQLIDDYKRTGSQGVYATAEWSPLKSPFQ